MPQVKIVARNFMDMVASLPAMKLDKLYENSFICEAILRDDKEPPKLTESGFQFLLMDTNAQLWYIVREYINNCEIISFLQQNAHPRVAERTPSVPENVTDQIRLWEADLNRVEMTPSHLYDEFPSRDVFDAACDFAREYGGLLWENSKKMRLVVKAEIFTQMKEFLRRQKQ
ncbi:General transcription and DNA repair factor IIH subunit TFB2 [Sesamum angolense]|uniref:RNA polymerase II transcription factor B subunit 2 n=1 Tax=Sesamum angolense TaxID=2727404 RepID=A0AAE1WJ06_9LAMI|nr:General transcription and DNA repair factor IIH subunit TFB2 [Sesamum angolense]